MKTDLARSLRRLKPETRPGTLLLRKDGSLPFADAAPTAGPPMLLDTTVYLHILEGRAPPSVKSLLRARSNRHVSVVLGELSNHFGRRDPSSSGYATLSRLKAAIDRIPADRVTLPSAGVCLEAGILSGLIHRLGGFSASQTLAALNDATIFLHALDQGFEVLTANIGDFDRMHQIMPIGRMILYRAI